MLKLKLQKLTIPSKSTIVIQIQMTTTEPTRCHSEPILKKAGSAVVYNNLDEMDKRGYSLFMLLPKWNEGRMLLVLVLVLLLHQIQDHP